MGENKNFTSSPAAKELAKAFGASDNSVKVPARSGQEAKKFIADLNAIFEATSNNSLQFG